MSDPLAGSDTYDILGGIEPAELPAILARWGRLEQHELVQMPHWAAHVGRLLIEAGKEIERLRALVGAVSPGPSLAELRAVLPQHDLRPER